MKKYVFALVTICLAGYAMAQHPQVVIPGSEVRKISSVAVNQEYELQILLPGNYGKTDKKYPVVYLMDSQWDFPLLKSIYGQQYYDGFIPELIIVGVTWGGNKPNPDSLRVRDYTPSNDGKALQAGGAHRFLLFMKNELFPFVESNYRASDSNRILMGCSLGGLFTMYTLFTQPALFSGYVAASPAVGWDKEVLDSYEQQFAKAKLPEDVRVYLTVGDVERSRRAFEKFAARLKRGTYPAIIRSKVLENTGHSGTKSETYTRGLQFIFQKPKLDLGSALLNRYVGDYKADGRQVELRNKNGQLVLFVSPQEQYALFAASATEFYSSSEFLNLSIKMEGKKVEGFRLDTYGSSQFMSKAE